MHSKATFRLIRLSTFMLCAGGGAPLTWKDNQRLTLLPPESPYYPYYYIYVGAHFLNLVLYEVFVGWRVVGALLSKAPLSTLLQVVWNFLSYAFPLLLQLNNFGNWEEFPAWINSYLRHFQSWGRENGWGADGGMGPGLRVLKVFLVLGCAITLQNVLLIFKYPGRPYFLTSLLSGGGPRIGLTLLQGWVWLSCWSHIFYYCFNFFSYAYPIVYMLKRLRREERSSTKILQSSYRSLQVLQGLLNYSCRWMFPAHKGILLGITTVGVYGAIRLEGPRALVMGITASLALLYLSIMFWRLGKIYQRSGEMLEAWKGRSKGKEWRRWLRSSPPLRVEIGPFYIVDKSTVLVIWATVLNFTTTLLLSVEP